MIEKTSTKFDFTASFESTVARYQELSDGKRRDAEAYIQHTVESHQAINPTPDKSIVVSDG